MKKDQFKADFGSKLKNHVNSKKQKTKMTPLQKILNEIQELNFTEKVLRYSRFKEDDKDENQIKVLQKHILVICVDELLDVAKKLEHPIVYNQNKSYIYNGMYWKELDQKVVMNYLNKAANKMGVKTLDNKFYKFKDELYKQFISTADTVFHRDNDGAVRINLLNGTYEFIQGLGRLRDFDKNDFITYQLPFKYDPQEEAPKFKEYLDYVLPEVASQSVIAEYLGYVFLRSGSGSFKAEKMLVLHGEGANGKSVLFEIVSAMIGKENISNFSLKELTDDNGYNRAMIAGKLLNYCTEIEGKVGNSYLKKMVSGEPLTARLPHGVPFTVYDIPKIIVNSNILPKNPENTNGFFRRFLIVPFTVTVPKEKQDKELHQKIITTELSGVFNWVLKGLDRLVRNKRFTHSEIVENANNKYQTISNNVKLFVEEEGYQRSSKSTTLLKALYSRYSDFCYESGYKKLSKSNFSSRLEVEGFQKDRKSNGVVFYIEKKNGLVKA